MAKNKSSNNDDIQCLFSEEEFDKHNEKYGVINIATAVKEYSIINGINRNVARHIPSGYDGLKPVLRRTLLVLSQDSSRKPQKVNKVAGNVMGLYHPHGDAAIEEVIGRSGQNWNNNLTYIDVFGNIGNEQGDDPAAGRYITCCLSKFANKCFFEDYKYAAVDMRTTYTGEGLEPVYLPAKYPVALVNPQFSSIGYGTAANIAPYNFTEVCEATIALIKDPDSKIHLIPDFPNGCEVVADNHLEEVNKSGSGKVTVRSTIVIDHATNIINIRSLPLKVGTKDVTSTLARLIVDKKISGIKDIKDYTNKMNGVWVQIILDKDVNPDKMLDDLIKKNIGLQKTFNVQIKFIEDYKEHEYTPKEYLLNWIDFRREIVQSMHNKRYVKLMEDKHLNDIKLFIFRKDNITETIKIIRKSGNLEDIVNRLVARYKDECGITTLQARAIAGMRMYEFGKDKYQEFLDKDKDLKVKIAESEKIIGNPALIDEIIIKELEEGIKLFGTPRRSKIISTKKDAKKVDDKMVLIAISKDGYIKKINSSKYDVIGKLGNMVSQEILGLAIRNDRSILVFDVNGKVTKVPVSGIPEMTPDENGILMSRFFKTTGSIVSILQEIIKEVSEDMDVVFISKNGFAKRTSAKEFTTVKDLKTCMNVNTGDELIVTDIVRKDDKKDIIIYTDLGNGIRLSASDIPVSGANTKGKVIMSMKNDEHICGSDFISLGKKYLFYITQNGRCKVTELKYFPRMNIKDDAISLINLTKGDKLVKILPVNKTDRVRVYKKHGEAEELLISDIPLSLRASSGDKLVKTPKGDIIIGANLIK